MKNKDVYDLIEVLDYGVENIENLGINSEDNAILVPSKYSDYYLASKLSAKFGYPIKNINELVDMPHDAYCNAKVIYCTSYAYDCEDELSALECTDKDINLIGCLLTTKSVEEARSSYPDYVVLNVVDSKHGFIDTGECPEMYVRRIIDYIGDDPTRSGVEGTPERVVRMWNEIYAGYNMANKPKITTFVEESSINPRDIIFDKGEAWSNCEHHMAPFKIEYCFAYIPNPKGKLLGLSKISRVVRFCSQKLQLQERIGKDVVDMIVDELTSGVGEMNPPLGVAIMLKGAHSCKTMRGVKTPGTMLSTYTWGCFEEHNDQRKEFIDTAKEMLGGGSVIFG